MPPRPLLSIITVTYNDPSGLHRTLDSLGNIVEQAGDLLEVLVVNGGNESDVASAAQSFPWAKISSGADAGIYDAMNKGLNRSSGSFVWFLNGGDESCLQSWNDISSPLLREDGSIFLAAYYLRIGPRSILRQPRKPTYIWHGLPTSHQAIYYPGGKAREMQYDLRFSMVGDYDFTAKMFVSDIPVKRLSLPVAQFYMDGVSFDQAYRVAEEAARVQLETLQSPPLLRWLSRTRHLVSRNVRRLQSKLWV